MLTQMIIIDGLTNNCLFEKQGLSDEYLNALPDWLHSAIEEHLKNMDPEQAVRFSWKEIDPNGEDARKVLEGSLPHIDMGIYGLYIPEGPPQTRVSENERNGASALSR